jgi:hypothetical protein
MSKIIQAINAMISNPDLITNVVQSGKEFFFLYKNKYKWSIRTDNSEEDNYFLFFYPGDMTIDILAGLDPEDWDDVPLIRYQASEIGTKEARASMSELYTLVQERLYRINEALDDIISG